MKKILSILIPTRNREHCALGVVNSILEKFGDDIEIVLQDNGDTNKLEQDIQKLDDSRIIYNYVSDEISFSKNFDIGIKLCTGSFITVIGDDDGVNPEIVDLAYYLRDNKIDAVSFKSSVSYYWPGIETLTETNGVMQVGTFSCNAQLYNTSVEFEKLLANGGQEYLRFGLPKLYHGIVNRSKVDEIVDKYEKCFDSLSPDIFSTTLLTKVIREVLVTDYPFTIAGSSPKSASAASITKKHEGELSSAPHFRGFEHYEWSKFVPKFYSVETIWAESLIFALNRTKDYSAIEKLDIQKLCQFCYSAYPHFRPLIVNFLEDYQGYKMQKFNLRRIAFIRKGKKLYKRIRVRAEIILGKRIYKKFDDVPDIGKSLDLLNEYLSNNNSNVNRVKTSIEELIDER